MTTIIAYLKKVPIWLWIVLLFLFIWWLFFKRKRKSYRRRKRTTHSVAVRRRAKRIAKQSRKRGTTKGFRRRIGNKVFTSAKSWSREMQRLRKK